MYYMYYGMLFRNVQYMALVVFSSLMNEHFVKHIVWKINDLVMLADSSSFVERVSLYETAFIVLAVGP